MITEINPEDVIMWSTRKLWNMFEIIVNKEKGYEKQKQQVKFGINLEFPIHYITQEWYELYPASKKASIKGYGKFPLQEFMDEIEQREEIMKEIIIENIEKEEITSPRTE